MSEGSGGFLDRLFRNRKQPEASSSPQTEGIPDRVEQISKQIQDLREQTKGFTVPQDRMLQKSLEEEAKALGFNIGPSGEPLPITPERTAPSKTPGFSIDAFAQEMAEARRKRAESGDQPINTNPAAQALNREQPTPPLPPDPKPETE